MADIKHKSWRGGKFIDTIRRMRVQVYQDYVHNNGMLLRALEAHFGVPARSVDAHEIIDGCLAGADLFVMPGGADLYYCEKLNGAGNAAIRAFSEQGGTYLGICAGAYYACARVDWAANDASRINGARELAFYPGAAEGPVYSFIEDGDIARSWQGAARLVYDDGDARLDCKVSYAAGPVFTSGAAPHVKTIARYQDLPGTPAAIVECRIGRGKAILCSPHLERTGADLTRKLYRHDNNSHAWEQNVANDLRAEDETLAQLRARLFNRCSAA